MATKSKSKKIRTELTISRPQLMVEGSDRAFRQFLHDTLAFSARLQAVRGQLGAVIGLSGTQYTVLIAIAHLSGIDEKVGVNKLVAGGLVEKETDKEDRRRVVLTITAKARALLNELAPVQRPVNDVLFRAMTAADFERTRKLMSDMVDAADEAIRMLDYSARKGPAKPAK
jgi:hypothetical protein